VGGLVGSIYLPATLDTDQQGRAPYLRLRACSWLPSAQRLLTLVGAACACAIEPATAITCAAIVLCCNVGLFSTMKCVHWFSFFPSSEEKLCQSLLLCGGSCGAVALMAVPRAYVCVCSCLLALCCCCNTYRLMISPRPRLRNTPLSPAHCRCQCQASRG
jgi:hypothetical protein